MPNLRMDSWSNAVGRNLKLSGKYGDHIKGYFSVIHENVTVGRGSTIGSYCELEQGTTIGANCTLQGRVRTGPEVTIEDDVVIKYGTILTDTALVKKNAFIGPNVITLGGGHDRKRVNGTIIGENCYIGAGTKIAGGVTICDDVVTGANSFVTKDITEPGVYVGTPAKLMRKRKEK